MEQGEGVYSFLEAENDSELCVEGYEADYDDATGLCTLTLAEEEPAEDGEA